MRAERVIVDYYEALAIRDLEAAADFLAPEIKEMTGQRDLSQSVQGLEKLSVSTMQPVRSSNEQLIYYVRFFAEGDTLQPSAQNASWRRGDNAC